MKELDFLHVDTYSSKLKFDWKILGWVWSKMGVTTPFLCLHWVFKDGCGYLDLVGYLKSVASQEWTNEMSWFLHADTNLGNLKVTLIFIGWVWTKMDNGALESCVSHKWVGELRRLI